MAGEDTPYRLFGKGGRELRGHSKRAVPQGMVAEQAGALGVWPPASVLGSLLAFLKAYSLPLSNTAPGHTIKNLPY